MNVRSLWYKILGIGTDAVDSSSIFDVYSSAKGSRPFPIMTTVQRDAIVSPANGLFIFNSTEKRPEYYDGVNLTWKPIGSGGTGYQEILGMGDGVTLSFPLTFVPSNDTSIIVFANTVKIQTSHWSYNLGTNSVDFVTAPATGVTVYVFYLTGGSTLSVPTPTGVQVVDYHTISLAEETAKQIVLGSNPAAPGLVMIDVLGGTAQEYGGDYQILGFNILDWNGLGMDGLVNAGDKLRIFYFS